MIDEKKIKKAMSFYTAKTWDHIKERFAAMDGFEAGAEWAQQEFVNSLWHDASEEPKEGATVIVVGVENGSTTYLFDSDYPSWKDEVEMWKITKWCYLSDILPKEGGEG